MISYWRFHKGKVVFKHTLNDTEVDAHLFFRTLRNSFQHFNYKYENLSSIEYFQQLKVHPAVKIPEQAPADNYLCYLVDYVVDNNNNNKLYDLRIIKTNYAKLKYWLNIFIARIVGFNEVCFGIKIKQI